MAGVFGGGKPAKSFEIELDSPFVVFYGDQHEAEPGNLSGVIKLDAHDHMSIKAVKIKLEGKWKVSWQTQVPSQPMPSVTIKDKGVLISDEQTLFPSTPLLGSTHRIAPGMHEWRFNFTMDPNLPESVEGLQDSCIVYNLTAEIERGYMTKSLTTRKHVRLIRTLTRDMTDTMPFPYSNEDTWVDKIRYNIYMPSRYYAFGTSIPVDFTLIPLNKGIKIGKARMELLERLTLEASKQDEELPYITLGDRSVATVEAKRPQDISQQIIEPSSGEVDESLRFQLVLPLRKSLNSCRQTVQTDHIKIVHNLKIYVNIHNPDGHVSQLCLRHMVHIYISPHTSIRDDQSVATPVTNPQDGVLVNGAGFDTAPPPQYGTHVLDQLYSDIDTSGFMSGLTTPMHYLSRAHSTENLVGPPAQATDENRSSDQSDVDSQRSSTLFPDMASAQIQARLQAFQDRRPSIASISSVPNTPPIITGEFVGGNQQTPGSEPQITLEPPTPISALGNQSSSLFTRRQRSSSLRNSMHLAPSTASLEIPRPQNTAPATQITFNLEALNRVPSYDAAMRAPLPEPPSPSSEGLPSYDHTMGLSSASSSSSPAPHAPPTPPADDDEVPPHVLCPLFPPAAAHSARAATPPLAPGESSPPSSRFAGWLHPDNALDRVHRPPQAHTRSASLTVNQDQQQGKVEYGDRRRPSLGLGGSPLHNFWSGLRRGSTPN